MRLEEVRLEGIAGWPDLNWTTASAGINVVYGLAGSGKTTVVEFLAHVLFGRPSEVEHAPIRPPWPAGEAIVELSGRRYRLRRQKVTPMAARLTVAALDGSTVDKDTVRSLIGGLSPNVLGPLCAPSFSASLNLDSLLSAEFAREFQSITGSSSFVSSRRTAELTARCDLLAQELETRIAGERRVSKELDDRWRELDRLVRLEQQQTAAREERLRTVDAALAETDARLRYRRLEQNTDLRWQSNDDNDSHAHRSAEIDEQIARWRLVLADLSEREARVRSQLAKLEPAQSATLVFDQSAWLAVARQLSADLVGQISRLARASASQQCLCHDAHPRLRPIAETLQRQIDTLGGLFNTEGCAHEAANLQTEIDCLARAAGELRRYLEHLLDRRQAITRGVMPPRALIHDRTMAAAESAHAEANHGIASIGAADVAQLEQRRIELEHERFALVEHVRERGRALRDLRAQRDTVERQRAALLSVRSIEHVQRELADVQRKLEKSAAGGGAGSDLSISAENPWRASDYLAQLTDGELVRLVLVDGGRRAQVTNRAGETAPFEALPAAHRDQVYLSLCLALLSAAAAQRGLRLPLVLDDPFVRLDSKATASLAAVLDGFSRQDHQVLVLTGQPSAAERFAALGNIVLDLAGLRRANTSEHLVATDSPLSPPEQPTSAQRIARRKPTREKRTKRSTSPKRRDAANNSNHSDAA